MSEFNRVSDLYPARWVKASDLNGQAVAVTILEATVESFYVPQINDQKTAVVLSFEGKRKRLILNKTQCLALVAISGSDVFSDWSGQVIALAPGRAPNGKLTVVIQPVPDQGVRE